jgi:hypothetical protein
MRRHPGSRDAPGMKTSVRESEALWEEWRSAADQVWEAWCAVVASTDGGDEPHRWYLEALDYEQLAADRLALALAD